MNLATGCFCIRGEEEPCGISEQLNKLWRRASDDIWENPREVRYVF